MPIALLPPCQWTLKFSFLYTWIRLLSTLLTTASPLASCCTSPSHDRTSHSWRGICTRFNAAPHQAHLEAAHHIFRYLKGTLHLAILYWKGERVVPTAFSDSDYQGNLDERRSTSAYAFNISSSLTSWHSKLQSEVSMSTCEAEYRALADAASEAAWLRGLLEEIGMPLTEPITIHCDNQSTIKLAKNPVQNARTKHIERQIHFVRHHVKQGRISINFVKSRDQLVDILTKPLPP